MSDQVDLTKPMKLFVDGRWSNVVAMHTSESNMEYMFVYKDRGFVKSITYGNDELTLIRKHGYLRNRSTRSYTLVIGPIKDEADGFTAEDRKEWLEDAGWRNVSIHWCV